MKPCSVLFAGLSAALAIGPADRALSNSVIGFQPDFSSSGVVLVQSESADGGETTADAVDPDLIEAFLDDPDGFVAALDDLELLAQVVRAAINADPENAEVIVALADRNTDSGVLAALSDGVTQAVADYALKGEQDAVSQILADVSEAVSGDFAEQVTEKVEQVAPEVAAQQAPDAEPDVVDAEPVPEAEEDATPQADTAEGEVAGDETETAAVDTQSEVLSQPTDTAPAIGGDEGSGGGATDGTSEVTSTSSGTSEGSAPSSSSGGSSLPAIGSSGSGGSDSTPPPDPVPASPA